MFFLNTDMHCALPTSVSIKIAAFVTDSNVRLTFIIRLIEEVKRGAFSRTNISSCE